MASLVIADIIIEQESCSHSSFQQWFSLGLCKGPVCANGLAKVQTFLRIAFYSEVGVAPGIIVKIYHLICHQCL